MSLLALPSMLEVISLSSCAGVVVITIFSQRGMDIAETVAFLIRLTTKGVFATVGNLRLPEPVIAMNGWKGFVTMCDQKRLRDLLDMAILVATNAHAGQVDKGGNPYILHPQAVADSVDGIENKIVAYLHDVCEDTEITFEDLHAMGFPDSIVGSVRAITKTRGVSYDAYLTAVKQDAWARSVKIADIKHNMDLSRIPSPTAKDHARVEKYGKALSFLQGETEGESQ